MLIFFIHGVATTNSQYAGKLESLIKKEFSTRGEKLPYFHSSFWGSVVKDISKMWNLIDRDLQEIKQENPQTNLDDIFRYRQFREGLLSDFVGDALTYLNSERGAAIRNIIARDLQDFLKSNPEEQELHIIAHSLGSVILWNILFSDKFRPKDPAMYIRAMLNGFEQTIPLPKVTLKTITTIGSPISFFNVMLDVKPERVNQLAITYKDKPLVWTNIIHSSDIIAYPLKSNLNLDSSNNLVFKDEYIYDDANTGEKAARAVGQMEAAMAIAAADAHSTYLHCPQTAKLIAGNILEEKNLTQEVINHLLKILGMTKALLELNHNPLEKTLECLNLKDGSGTIQLRVNPFQIHSIYVFDKNDSCLFGGYVGVIHTQGLKKEFEYIKKKFCD